MLRLLLNLALHGGGRRTNFAVNLTSGCVTLRCFPRLRRKKRFTRSSTEGSRHLYYSDFN